MKIIVINHIQASPKPRILLGYKILIACCGAVSADTNTVASLEGTTPIRNNNYQPPLARPSDFVDIFTHSPFILTVGFT